MAPSYDSDPFRYLRGRATGKFMMPGGGSTKPLRIAGWYSTVADSSVAAASGQTAFILRVPIYIGSTNWTKLRLMLQAWTFLGGNLGNSMQIDEAALEYAGAYVPITFGGSPSITLADGATEIQSDDIPGKNRHSLVFIRMRGSVPTSGNFARANYTASNSPVAYNYDASLVTPVSPVYGTGALNATGLTTIGNAVSPVHMHLIGEPSGAEKAVLVGYGDSIMQGIAGTNLFGVGADQPGWFGQSCRTFDYLSLTQGVYAALNLGVSGRTQVEIAARPKLLGLMKYCNIMVDQGGTNGIATGGVAAETAATQAIWAAARGMGIASNRIIRAKIAPRTTSSNSFIDAAGQSYVARFAPGADVNTFNDFVDASLVSGNIGAIMSMSSIRDGAEPYKWISNGATNAYTTDGTHPGSAATHRLLRAECKTTWEAVARANGLWNDA